MRGEEDASLRPRLHQGHVHDRSILAYDEDGPGLGLVVGGLTRHVVRLIQGITREHFYKSMTTLADHRVWQDVYHVPFEGLVLYVKFTTDAQGYLVISFKEK